MSYLVLGLEGQTLSSQEADWVARPDVAGVILFTRNCASPRQVRELTDSLRAINPGLMVCIDQEGGRVQRVRSPLWSLPPLRRLGEVHETDPEAAARLASAHGELMAQEVLALGVDLSLAPVLDLDAGCSVIGDRAFHSDPQVVSYLAGHYVAGMGKAGMRACGKHFPGHGTVCEDTHVAVAVDERDQAALSIADLLPFRRLARDGIDALMMAHVCYPAVCSLPAGYSPRWIGDILRGEMGYEGVVISDDLGMRAACSAGDLGQRAQASLDAGCDLVLVCAAEDVRSLMSEPQPRIEQSGALADAADRLRADHYPTWAQVESCERRAELTAALSTLDSPDQGTEH